MSQSGFQALKKILGLSQGDVNRSIYQHSMNLDYAEIMEDFLRNEVSPQTSKSATGSSLTKDQVYETVNFLNDSQFNAAREAQEFFEKSDQNDENVIEEI